MSIKITLTGKRGKEEEETIIQGSNLANKKCVFFLTKATPFESLNAIRKWAKEYIGAELPSSQEFKRFNLPEFITEAARNLGALKVALVGLIIDQPHSLYHFEVCADVPEKQPSILGLNLIKLTSIGFVLTKASKKTFETKAAGGGRKRTKPR